MLGLTQRALAEELGTKEQMVYLYESGARRIPNRRSARLAAMAQRERARLDTRKPCPACQGTGWTAGDDVLAAILDAPEPELALPVQEITARGPGGRAPVLPPKRRGRPPKVPYD